MHFEKHSSLRIQLWGKLWSLSAFQTFLIFPSKTYNMPSLPEWSKKFCWKGVQNDRMTSGKSFVMRQWMQIWTGCTLMSRFIVTCDSNWKRTHWILNIGHDENLKDWCCLVIKPVGLLGLLVTNGCFLAKIRMNGKGKVKGSWWWGVEWGRLGLKSTWWWWGPDCPRSPFHLQPLTHQVKPKDTLWGSADTAKLCLQGRLTLFFLQVLNSGGQLQISRPAPEPPRTNGGNGNVYQQPHQHVNSNGTYGEYVGQRQSEEEGWVPFS